jgi:hypothetical protein
MSRVCRWASCRQLIFCVKRGRELSGSPNEWSSHGIQTSAPLVLVSNTPFCFMLTACVLHSFISTEQKQFIWLHAQWMVCILYTSALHPLCFHSKGVCDASASSAMHPLHPLCIHLLYYVFTSQLSQVTPLELSSTSIRQTSDERPFNKSAT